MAPTTVYRELSGYNQQATYGADQRKPAVSEVHRTPLLAVQRSLSSDGDKAAARDHKAHDLLILLPTRHNPFVICLGPLPGAGTGG